MTPRELKVQRMTLRHLDAQHRAEIRRDVEARWPVTLANIQAEYEEVNRKQRKTA